MSIIKRPFRQALNDAANMLVIGTTTIIGFFAIIGAIHFIWTVTAYFLGVNRGY